MVRPALVLHVESKVLLSDVILTLYLFWAEARVDDAEEAGFVDLVVRDMGMVSSILPLIPSQGVSSRGRVSHSITEFLGELLFASRLVII